MSENNFIKFIILGEGPVGKTLILQRYFNNKFKEEKSIINNSFFEMKRTYEGKEYRLTFLDTKGKFESINNMYYQNAVDALIVYDVTIPETFEKAKRWVYNLREIVGKDIIFVIAGNKYDISNKDVIDENKANIDNYCQKENCSYFYISAKTGYNLEETFKSLITSVLQKVSKEPNEENKKSRGRGKGRKLENKEPKEKKVLLI